MRANRDMYLEDLGVRLADRGFGANRGDVTALVALARSSGLRSGAVDVLGDWAAAEVVRFRAFAKVASMLSRQDNAIAVEPAA